MTTPKLYLRAFKLQSTILVLTGFVAIAAAQTATGSIQGSLADANTGKPISGAIVTAIRNGLPPLSQNVTSETSGSFQISKLPAGTYHLCIQAPGGNYLNPCHWQPLPPTITLAAGQNSTGNSLKIVPGSPLQVRLNDPSGVAAAVSVSSIPPIDMSVRNSLGIPVPLTMLSKDSGGSTHQVVIPFDAPVSFQISSNKLTLTQADGSQVAAAGAQLSVTHPSASAVAAPPLVFQVAGVKP